MRIFSTFRYLIILLALFCASCGTALPTIKPYKLDVQQGNVVTSKMLLQLRPGMTKSQVRFIMGTPLVQDSFHGNRWDYVYQMREKGKIIDQSRVILDFEGDALKTVRGDVVPKAGESNAEGAANNGTRVITPTGKPEEKGWFDKLKFWKKDESALNKEDQAAKAKADAEEAAKEAAAKQSATPLLEDSSPIMAVPLDGIGIVPSTKAEEPVLSPMVETSSVDAVPAVTKPESVAPAKAKRSTVKSKKKQNKTDVILKSETPTDSQKTEEKPLVNKSLKSSKAKDKTYGSSSDMNFDRNLNSGDEAEPLAGVNADAQRAGNKSIPKPQTIPEENKVDAAVKSDEKVGF